MYRLETEGKGYGWGRKDIKNQVSNPRNILFSSIRLSDLLYKKLKYYDLQIIVIPMKHNFGSSTLTERLYQRKIWIGLNSR